MLHPNIHGHFQNICTDKGWDVGQMFAYDVWMGCKKTKSFALLLNGPFGKNARVTSWDDISFCCFGSPKYFEIHESDKTCYPCRELTFGGHFLWKKFSLWFDAKHAKTQGAVGCFNPPNF